MDILNIIYVALIFTFIFISFLRLYEYVNCQHKLKDLSVERADEIQEIKGENVKIKTTLFCRKCNKTFEEINYFNVIEYRDYLESIADRMYLPENAQPRK